MRRLRAQSTQGGFSLAELAAIFVILGVLALAGVPKFQVMVERSKATEAFIYLGKIQAAQERYNARAGRYASQLQDLDVELEFPRHFRFGSLTSFKWETHWQLRVFRAGPSSGYQAYSVCYNQDGYDPLRSSIPAEFAMGGIGGMQTPGGGVPPSTPEPSGQVVN
jgi:Tfp pilus assembly protein PilE